MGDEQPVVISSGQTLSPESVASRTFTSAFRGYHPAEVRQLLKQVGDELAAGAAREAELRRALQGALNRAAHPELDEAALTKALGEHAAQLLANARHTAASIVGDAQKRAEAVLRDADARVARMRDEAESLLARRLAEADAATAAVRREGEDEIRALVEQARTAAETEVEQARQQGREMVAAAREVRERMLSDLTRRRRAAQLQVEQLRAGRARLLAAYDVVQRTVDEATAELDIAEPQARLAAEAVARAADDIRVPAAARAVAAAPAPERPLVLAAAAPAHPRGGPPAPPTPVLRRVPSSPPSDDVPPALRPQTVADAVARPAPPPVRAAAPKSELETGEHPVVPADPRPANGNGNGHGNGAGQAERNVDDVFARIRADQTPAGPPVEGSSIPAPAEAEPAATALEPRPALDPVATEHVLAGRDALLDEIESGLVKALKRALQDEENEVLDRLRRLGPSDAAGVLPAAVARTDALAAIALPWLHQAAQAGAVFASDAPDPSGAAAAAPALPPLDPLAAALAAELVGPLSDRLTQALADGDDPAVAAETVRAAYRQRKLQHVEPGARHAVLAAFGAGAFAATPASATVQWVVEGEGHCADCDDNALAGPIAKGQAFPTGQLHPPAHPGCRCLLAPAPA